MQRRNFLALLGAGFVFGPGGLAPRQASAAMGMGPGMMGMGPGMMGGCPMCGHDAAVSIPDRLPPPGDGAWREGLDRAHALERLSLLQYETDSALYGAHMPYRMVIPQEGAHIAWIERLYAAYGLAPPVETPRVRPTDGPNDAFRVAMGLEGELAPEYERLVATAGDPVTRDVLDVILRQTRWHYMMFSHAGRMMGMGHGLG